MARDSSGPKNVPVYSGTGVPADSADLTELGAVAGFLGNRKVGPATGTPTGPGGSNTGRNTSTGADVWDGLEWYDTTDKGVYEYVGSGWTRRRVIRLGANRYSANGTLGAAPAWTDLCTVTATSTGGLCMADWRAIYYNAGSGLDRTAQFQVVCDGTVVGEVIPQDVPLSADGTGRAVAWKVESTVTAGSHVWKLQGNCPTATAVGIRFATLEVTEV